MATVWTDIQMWLEQNCYLSKHDFVWKDDIYKRICHDIQNAEKLDKNLFFVTLAKIFDRFGWEVTATRKGHKKKLRGLGFIGSTGTIGKSELRGEGLYELDRNHDEAGLTGPRGEKSHQGRQGSSDVTGPLIQTGPPHLEPGSAAFTDGGCEDGSVVLACRMRPQGSHEDNSQQSEPLSAETSGQAGQSWPQGPHGYFGSSRPHGPPAECSLPGSSCPLIPCEHVGSPGQQGSTPCIEDEALGLPEQSDQLGLHRETTPQFPLETEGTSGANVHREFEGTQLQRGGSCSPGSTCNRGQTRIRGPSGHIESNELVDGFKHVQLNPQDLKCRPLVMDLISIPTIKLHLTS